MNRTKKKALVVLDRSWLVIPLVSAANGAWNNIPIPTPAIMGYSSLTATFDVLLNDTSNPIRTVELVVIF